jgi:hypothetical protein
MPNTQKVKACEAAFQKKSVNRRLSVDRFAFFAALQEPWFSLESGNVCDIPKHYPFPRAWQLNIASTGDEVTCWLYL